ncbi:MAG TPA: hypothetical protein VN648_23170, partial [Candidatus Methylomirabilis sp.]|nr:hypothetical protein [Candidatus Methylomirabilis sp.]
MKLVSYAGDNHQRLGVVMGDYIVDVEQTLELCEWGDTPDEQMNEAAQALQDSDYPYAGLAELLAEGDEFLRA